MSRFEYENFNYQNLRWEHPLPELNSSHMHPFYELLYFIEGDANYIFKATSYKLNHGDLVLICPSTYHYLKLNSTAPYARQTIHFTSCVVDQHILNLIKNCDGIYSIPSGSIIDNLFLHLSELENFLSNDEMNILIKDSLEIVLTKITTMKSNLSKNAIAENDTLNKIIKYIDEHLNEPINIENIANYCYLSASYIAHLFSSKMYMSVQKYINRKKMIYAQELIKSGLRPTKVALSLGYDNYSTFYRLYKLYNNENSPKIKNFKSISQKYVQMVNANNND